MSWFDSISEGAGSVMNWFRGGGGGGGAAPAHAPAPAAAGGGAGGAAAAPAESHWGESAWAKATGLAPWAKMLGVGQGPEADPSKGGTMESRIDHQLLTGYGTKARPTGGDSASDIVHGKGDFRSNEIEGDKKVTGFGRDSKGGFKTPEYNNWSAKGKSFGNREDDVVDDELGKKGKATGAPTVWQPSLDKIGNSDPNSSSYDPRSTGYNIKSGVLDKDSAAEKAKADGADYNDSGSFRSSKYGSYSGTTGLASQKWDPEKKMMVDDPNAKFTVGHNGKGSMGIAGWEGQWGAEEKGGWRATHASKDGNTTASAEAGWVASGGASGSYGLDTAKGLNAQAGIGGKAGVYAQGDADTKTDSVKVGGVDYNAGIGVHGDTFAGVKAGASGQIGLGPDFIGAKGDIGAFAGAEAAADVHGNLGPLGAKAGGSLMAGAGIGAEGDISYKDGKFHVGGKMFAALGYGGSLSGDITIDVGAMGRSAYQFGSDAVDAVGDAASTAYDYGSQAVSAIGNAGSAAISTVGNVASGAYDLGASAVSSVLSW